MRGCGVSYSWSGRAACRPGPINRITDPKLSLGDSGFGAGLRAVPPVLLFQWVFGRQGVSGRERASLAAAREGRFQ
jgi:hypothetical protein